MACKELSHKERLPQVYLVRHGETEWALSGQHTGHTDIPLTANGLQQAALAARHFSASSRFVRMERIRSVLVSPLLRARQTWEGLQAAHKGLCRDQQGAALLEREPEFDPDLQEWDYGVCEGVTTVDIRKAVPDWTAFSHGCPQGECAADVAERCDRVIAKLRGVSGRGHLEGEECHHHDAEECVTDVLIVAHGHLLRVLAAPWLGLPPEAGRLFVLDTATLCVLGYEHDLTEPCIRGWNALP